MTAPSGREILSPGTKMDSREDDLLCAAGKRSLDVPDHTGQWARAAQTACHGRDAESTVIIAAILNLDEGACAPAQSRQGDPLQRLELRGVSGPCLNRERKSIRDQGVLARIRDHAPHLWQLCGSAGFERGPASGGDDLSGASAPSLPYLGARIGGSLAGHRTGIDHGQVGALREGDDLVSRSPKLARHDLD